MPGQEARTKLPAAGKGISSEKDRPGQAGEGADGGPGLVVCDDHPIIREQLVSLLTASGRFGRVSPAADGKALLEQVAKERPAIALVDLELPDLDGLSALEMVAEIDGSVRTVILSAHDDPELVVEARRRGAAGFVSKAEGSDGLLDGLAVILDGGEQFPPADGADNRIERLLSLSPREREILDLIANGESADDIGRKLGISRATVYTHIRNSMVKLAVNTRGEAIALAVRYSYLESSS